MSNSAALETSPSSTQEDFGWTLGVLVRNYQNASAATMGDLPHGARGYQVLVAVVGGELPNQLALAQHLGIDRTVMTYLIDDFVKAGLVERQLNPSDRRARIVVGTAAGKDALADLQRRVTETEDVVLAALEPAEREVFRTLLRRVACHTPAVNDHDLGACEAVEQMLGTAKS
ncbi:MarR family winged helix-turn-helix transcriptional regulator [Arthrobacter sp. GMC3]|uniref:MarR family winged helix-turn-helix transcriptional regulator n=1 Tax=Arthrobacter sp. GMC3 TaxID=2058894 RepID=UPI000CE50A1A|nr:MarR family winged helix-turn-helix transcriptional regulator [Arthrobacter sp. GMC3]